jgi:hypothetical protein
MNARVMTLTALIVALVIVGGYFIVRDPDSMARQCSRATSPNGQYVAELCLIRWGGGSNPEYLGRVYESKTGKLLVRRRFHTPVPELEWWKDEVSFSRGGDDASYVKLPPTLYDRLVADLPWQ